MKYFICREGIKSQSSFYCLLFTLYSLFFTLYSSAQENDSTKAKNLDEVLVQAIRANEKTPISFSNFTKKEISKRNLGQDIPILMNYLPSVVTTSDAGNGVGYTGIRVRGSDATRVNVTINGIPYNDSESSGTYFVNMPDFASSIQSIQLQRGVGTSTNGAGAFGASLSMLTDSYSLKSFGEINNSFGNFNTRKHTMKFSTGLLNDHFEIAGRLSKVASNGYIDRGKSDLKSYFLQGTFVGKTTLIKAIVFGGTEKTYQSWNGIDSVTLETNRTFNPSGQFFDSEGNTKFYDNETDNYQQDHYQLHWNEKISDNWNINLALHYTKGKGYFENYQFEKPVVAGVIPIKKTDDGYGNLIDVSNFITQKWLDNDFYGTTFSGNYKTEKLDFIIGGGLNRYEGRHFGKVIWARAGTTSELGDKYYNDIAYKNDANIFAKANYQIAKQFSVYGDLQYRFLNYKVNTVLTGNINDNFNFLNPKAGLNFDINQKNSLYFSYAKARREPNRTDYENGKPKPEELDDYELGWRFKNTFAQININGFYMAYKDQLVLTGALDNVGNPIRKNSGNSYRLGFELDAALKLNSKWNISPNITICESKNIDFIGIDLINLGNTNIPYSPKIIAGNILSFSPIENLQFIALSKFVGSQFLSNTNDNNAKLKDYYVQDFNVNYSIPMKTIFQSIDFNLLVNNIFNRKYVSNGADYGNGYVVYFPQAGSNFLIGMSLKF